MIKALLGTISGALLVMSLLAAWLIWPTPPLNVAYGPMIVSAYSEGDCDAATFIAGMYYSVDREGADKVVPELVRDGHCALLSRYYAPHSEATWRLTEVQNRPEFTERVRWLDAVGFSFVLWQIMTEDRRNAGLPQDFWIDAVTLFRCGRDMTSWRASSRYIARDMLREVRPGYVAPFDRRRARCMAHIRGELGRLRTLAEGQDNPHHDLLGLIMSYEGAISSYDTYEVSFGNYETYF